MTWRLKPDSPNVLRLVKVLAEATKPMKREELAEALGLSAQGLRRHLSMARHSGDAVLIGSSSAARWVSPGHAAAAQAEYDAVSSTRKYPRKKRVTEIGRWRDGQPIRVVSTEWAAGEVRGPNSVFALGEASR